MGDLKIPLGLKWLRVLLFVALCAWPSFIHVFLTGRAYSHYVIVPSGVVKEESDSAKWPAARGWKLALYPLMKPEWESGTRWWANSREEWEEVSHAEGVAPNFTKKLGLERVTTSAIWFQPILFDLVSIALIASTLSLGILGFLPRRSG